MLELVIGPAPLGPIRVVADGVTLNPGLPDERLPTTLMALARALAELHRGPVAVPLSRARLLWLIHADAGQAVLRWVRRGTPTSAVVRETRVDLPDLLQATAVALDPIPRTGAIRARLMRPPPPLEVPPGPGFEARFLAGPIAVALQVSALPRPVGTPWHRALAPGQIRFEAGGAALGALQCPPFLAADDLVRWAARAIRPGRREALPLSWGGALAADGDAVQIGDHRLVGFGQPVARAIAALTERLVGALEGDPPEPSALDFEPLQSLRERARALRAEAHRLTLAAKPGARSVHRPRPAPTAPPLAKGSVRKVSFELHFETHLPFAVQRLALVNGTSVAMGEDHVAGIDANGQVRWSRRAHAVCGEGLLLATEGERLVRLHPESGACRWFRDGDGLPPVALRAGPPGMALLVEDDALSGRWIDTGFPRWHLRPASDDRVFATATPDRIFAVTRSGRLESLDPRTGVPHFRTSLRTPVHAAPVPWNRALLLVVEGRWGDALAQVSAATGRAQVTAELEMRQVRPPVALRDRVACVGRTDEGWVLGLFDARLNLATCRILALTARRPPHLIALDARTLLIATDDGQALCFNDLGEVLFAMRDPAPPAAAPVPPVLQRQLALLAAERPVLLELATGRRLATLPAIDGLSAMAADPALRVVLATDGGTVRGHRLRGHLAVAPDLD